MSTLEVFAIIYAIIGFFNFVFKKEKEGLLWFVLAFLAFIASLLVRILEKL